MTRFFCWNPLLLLSGRAARCGAVLALAFVAACAPAQTRPAANPAPDVLVLSNGDTLHGKFVSAIQGKVTFHSDALGDISLGWDKIKELHTSHPFAVVDSHVKLHGRHALDSVPSGNLAVANQSVTVESSSATGSAPAHAPAPVATKDAAFILDRQTLENDIRHQPGLFSGWNGAATGGATLVTATQNQYTFSGGIGLVRVVPTVSWLDPRDRTSLDFTGSFGKITQPGYTDATDTYVPPVTTKSAIYHADAERDEYFSPRLFVLGQVAFDHNFSQDLDLQQIYGGGLGWTALKTPRQEADLKATAQYEKQQFISGSAEANQNLIGSTFSASYLLHTRLVTYTQGLAFIPAYNNPRAYSATETNTFAFPAYKNFSFSLGTLDSYLNDPPVSYPPTKRNSFQFTMGLTYAIKAK